MDTMQSSHFQECGPNEDHLCWKQHKVVENTLELSWGVQEVDRGCPFIDTFLQTVPTLCQQAETFGLVWDNNLRPSEGRYEPGEHYCMTREEGRKSAHGNVTFHRDGETGVKFAIKTLLISEVFNPEEVRIGLLGKHQNICRVYGIIVRSKQVNILLEHAGVPIRCEREWLARSSERKLLAAQQCFHALEFLATNNKVHCDVKPDNLTILREGEKFTIKMIDFGSCQRKGTNLPQHTHTTMEYWSPEMWCAMDERRPIVCDPAMDVYAMALTLYFLEKGQHLTQRIQDLQSVMVKMPVMVKMIALPDSLPADLRVLMASCLEVRPIRLAADEACKRLQDAKIPAIYLQAVSKPENYKESWKQLMMETFSHRLPAENRSPFLSSPDKLRESLASAVAPQPPAPQMEVPAKTPHLANTPEAVRGKPAASAGGKNFRRAVRQNPKVKTSLKPPLKAKELKNNKSIAFKGKDKEMFASLNHAPAAVNMVSNDSAETIYPITNILKNLAMKIKQSPEPALSVGQQVASKIPQKSGPECEKVVFESAAVPLPIVPSNKPDVSSNSSECHSVTHSTVTRNTETLDHDSELNDSSVSNKDSSQTESDMETTDDDVRFVFDVLDNNGLTGADDDITDWLYQSLSDKEKGGSSTSEKGNSHTNSGLLSVRDSTVICRQESTTPQKRSVLNQARLKSQSEANSDQASLTKTKGSAETQLPDFSQI